MGRAVRPDQPGAVEGKGHVEILQTDVMNDLIEELRRDDHYVQFKRAATAVETSPGPWLHTFRDRRGSLPLRRTVMIAPS